MKKIIVLITGICLSTALVTSTSCVSKRKYVAARTRASEMTQQNMALNARVIGQQDTINQLNKKIGALGNANENAANELYKTSSELNMTKDQIAAQRKRMEQLQALISQQQSASERLRKAVSDALTGFNSSELAVTMKNGRVYISMQEALLFPSGSAKVNPRGKEALAKVAAVLNTDHDVNIDIEGHTDNKPIKTAQYPDNWTLSTARATSIAHVLIDEYAVTPAKLIASGRAYYDPIADNNTPEGRAQNRRTEIILEPKYDELMQLMSNR